MDLGYPKSKANLRFSGISNRYKTVSARLDKGICYPAYFGFNRAVVPRASDNRSQAPSHRGGILKVAGRVSEGMTAGTGADWPIDPDGEAGSNGMRRFDMAILSKFEPKEAFPMDAETFLDRHGEKPVRINHRTIVSVADIFEGVPDDAEFADFPEFHRAVGRALREADYWPYRLEHA